MPRCPSPADCCAGRARGWSRSTRWRARSPGGPPWRARRPAPRPWPGSAGWTPRTSERSLASLTAVGILEELDGPPGPRWTFRDRLVAAALAAELGGAERRRRHAAALVSARSWGASTPAELLRHAVGAADAEAVVDYGVRSAEAARAEGAPRRALVDADRALTWWSAGDGARPAVGGPVRARDGPARPVGVVGGRRRPGGGRRGLEGPARDRRRAGERLRGVERAVEPGAA